MTVIARDHVAADHLVYAWPFPLGPECEVSCGDDEEVVMCPAWLVGDRLGPGHHRYRTPDPMRPVGAFFVLTSPVEVSFDMTTMFLVPMTRQPVRIRASGSLQVRCGDPGLLVAQFVGLPFDSVNEGILRSVSRSVERMLARLLTRRVVMAGTPLAVTDPQMQPSIIEELVAYNPTAGAVFGIELMRMGHLMIAFDDGTSPYVALPNHVPPPPKKPAKETEPLQAISGELRPRGERDVNDTQPSPVVPPIPPSGGRMPGKEAPLLQTMRGVKPAEPSPSAIVARHTSMPPGATSNVVGSTATERATREPSGPRIGVDAATERATKERSGPSTTAASGEILAKGSNPPAARVASAVEIPKTDDMTEPNTKSPASGIKIPSIPSPSSSNPAFPAFNKPLPPPPSSAPLDDPEDEEPRGSIMGIGMGIGVGASPKVSSSSGSVAGEIPSKVAPGGRVLVPGPNGLMQSATVRQLLQGYYELEVGSSGETIWVPINGVVPE